MDKDFYKIMGVAPTASEQEIKIAYRRLARKYHPDINKDPHAEEHFKEMANAYETLKDPVKRAEYDEYLKYGQFNQQKQDSSHHAKSHRQYYQQGQPEFDSDLFESLFGHARYQHHPIAGQDYHGTIAVSLEEAFHGTVKNLAVPNDETGSSQTLNVKIPAGVKTGQKIRLSGQGGKGVNNAPRGDLYLTIEVMKHPLFDIQDNDIYLALPVTPWEAALGATILIPTLSGKIDLKIPPGSQGGQKLRIKNRGLPGDVPGHQYVLLKIITPPATSEKAKELYQQMAKVMPFNPREHLGG